MSTSARENNSVGWLYLDMSLQHAMFFFHVWAVEIFTNPPLPQSKGVLQNPNLCGKNSLDFPVYFCQEPLKQLYGESPRLEVSGESRWIWSVLLKMPSVLCSELLVSFTSYHFSVAHFIWSTYFSYAFDVKHQVLPRTAGHLLWQFRTALREDWNDTASCSHFAISVSLPSFTPCVNDSLVRILAESRTA